MAIDEPGAFLHQPLEAAVAVEFLPPLEVVAAHLVENDEHNELRPRFRFAGVDDDFDGPEEKGKPHGQERQQRDD
jgi:hypothetical protein